MIDISRAGVPLDVAGVADTLAISRLQSAYADAVTRRAFDELNELFLPDCGIELDFVTRPPRRFGGPAELAAFVRDSTARFDHFQVVILNAVVDRTDPIIAAGRLYLYELRHDPAEGWSEAYGRYEDGYRKVDGRWWFASRRYRSLARGPATSSVEVLPLDG